MLYRIKPCNYNIQLHEKLISVWMICFHIHLLFPNTRTVCFTQPEADDYMCFLSFSIMLLSSLRNSVVGLLNDRTSLIWAFRAPSHSCYYSDVERLTFVSSILWACPLKISCRMVLIFNVAPILGVRCKQNVDERNPSLSLLFCLCRVCVLPIICPHESSRVWAQHLFGSLKSAHGLIQHLLKLCSPATV